MSNNSNITIKYLANYLDLSTATISQALNNKGHLNPKTIERVKNAALELGYKPNAVAKSLKLNSTKTLGVIVADSSHSFFAKVIKGITDSARNLGYSILLCNTDGDPDLELEAVELLVSKRIDGLILASSMLSDEDGYSFLAKFNVPFLFLIRRSVVPNANFVINDNINGAYLMTNYLLDISSQNPIYFFNMLKSSTSSCDREAGYKKALLDRNIPFDESLVRYMPPKINDGYENMKKLLLENPTCKVVFCACDVIAIGAMQAIKEHGLSVPHDIRICGYDDLDFTPYLWVPLSTVQQPQYLLGQTAAKAVVDIVENVVEQPHQITLTPELIIRDSA